MSVIYPVLLPLLVALLLATPVLLLAAPGSARAQGLGVSVGVGDSGVSVGVSDSSVSVGSGGGAEVGVEVGSGGSTAPSVSRDATDNEQEVALDAVRSARALPLDQIVVAARRHTSGEIIDARLIELRGFLLYELKVIEAGGDVADLYFYARSGEIVRTK
jgi:ferric-dicitrate binding protein FerR (iron transport regulator)